MHIESEAYIEATEGSYIEGQLQVLQLAQYRWIQRSSRK